jgi:hypothetical protein
MKNIGFAETYIAWNVIRSNLIFILFCGFLSRDAVADCLYLRVLVQDAVTRQKIVARLIVETSNGYLPIMNTKGSVIEIDCSAIALIVEKEGYRSRTLLLNQEGLKGPGRPLPVLIPLVRTDQQANDRPYSQSEQTHYVQSSGGKNTKQVIQKSVFDAMDVNTGLSISAQACFFFTKGAKRTCIDLEGSKLSEIDFVEKDIVALEVRADGYQTYRGNIVVEKMRKDTIYHHIRLLPDLVVLTVEAPQTRLQCKLRTQTGGIEKLVMPLSDELGQFCFADLTSGEYELLFADSSGRLLHRQTVVLRKGLNVVSNPTVSVASPVSDPLLAVLPLPDRIHTIYFHRSSYELQPESQKLLLEIAHFLRDETAYWIRLVGHTDNVGNQQRNLILSELRAQVTANYLFNLGIANNRLYKMGMGSRKPGAPNDTEENRMKNRRVTIEFLIGK